MSCMPSAIFLTPSSNSLLHQPGSSHSTGNFASSAKLYASSSILRTQHATLNPLSCFARLNMFCILTELCSAHPQAGSLYPSITTHPLLFCSHTLSIAHPRLKLTENWAVIALFDAGSWRGRESRHAQHMFCRN